MLSVLCSIIMAVKVTKWTRTDRIRTDGIIPTTCYYWLNGRCNLLYANIGSMETVCTVINVGIYILGCLVIGCLQLRILKDTRNLSLELHFQLGRTNFALEVPMAQFEYGTVILVSVLMCLRNMLAKRCSMSRPSLHRIGTQIKLMPC
jgi:hypothetical protein